MNERIPCATYRLQFHSGFRFENARNIVAYLDRLGITDLYSSPIWTARPGSMHGYDVVDHSAINAELGGEEELKMLSAALKELSMGLVVDIVPNHMGIIHDANRWWWDVLENGPSSPYHSYFDIDWNPPKDELKNRVLIPVLGDQFGCVLDNGELRLDYADGEFSIYYYEKHFPLDPRTWLLILEPALEMLKSQTPNPEHRTEFESIITSLTHLPRRAENTPENIEERQREKEVVKKRLFTLLQQSGTVREVVQETVNRMNGAKGDHSSFDDLAKLISDQAYRLSFWRVAADEINYRRFFDVNDLAAIRVELPSVFKAVHALIFRLMAEGHITGLRVDHPDGLFNPRQYFMDLQGGCYLAQASEKLETGEFPAAETDLAAWVVVEKILGKTEKLRPDWAVHGTTGYDYLNLLNALFVNSGAMRDMTRAHAKFTGFSPHFSLLMYQCKKLILDVSMSGELHVLARRLDGISEQHRFTRDFTLWSLQKALAEVIACFPVYRSYTRPEDESVADDDRKNINQAVRGAKRRNRAISESVYDFIHSVLLLEHPEGLTDEQKLARKDFVLRFQQMTGPVMAKGLEDTAFYREFPLVTLNEVGGEPDHFGMSVDEFHRQNANRFENWPHGMLTTSTHDTKRSEDVRARINVLSEMPREWSQALKRWRTMNRKKKQQVEGIHVPAGNEEYLLYQTMLGAWPFRTEKVEAFRERLKAYMVKAAREAKMYTSWINVDEAHENALQQFVEKVFDPRISAKFLEDFTAFQRTLTAPGAVNSLSQILLKCTSPGIPDFYQGMELWNFSLVDPDNRRPVDYELRESVLAEMEAGVDETRILEVTRDWTNSRIKMLVTYCCLQFRKSHPKLFGEGSYIPLQTEGPLSRHVCAFARQFESKWSITLAPRFVLKLLDEHGLVYRDGVWRQTVVLVPQNVPGSLKNEFTGNMVEIKNGHIKMEDVLGNFPIGLLVT